MVHRLLVKRVRVKTLNGPPKRSIRILVVDDELLMAQPLADALAAEGYEIDMAVNGQRALEKISDRAYSSASPRTEPVAAGPSSEPEGGRRSSRSGAAPSGPA
jgi:hypothetical protein